MTPAEFAEVVVVPTVCEFLRARADCRLAYLSCIATYSVIDHLRHANPAVETVHDDMRVACRPAYEVVQGICNGTKHARPDRGQFRFTPGSEQASIVYAYGIDGAYGHGRYGAPGLEVVHFGAILSVSWCVQAVLKAMITLYPKHLGSIGLSFVDADHRDWNPPTPPTPP